MNMTDKNLSAVINFFEYHTFLSLLQLFKFVRYFKRVNSNVVIKLPEAQGRRVILYTTHNATQ